MRPTAGRHGSADSSAVGIEIGSLVGATAVGELLLEDITASSS